MISEVVNYTLSLAPENGCTKAVEIIQKVQAKTIGEIREKAATEAEYADVPAVNSEPEIVSELPTEIDLVGDTDYA